MNLARAFAYTREIENQRTELQKQLAIERERVQELVDAQLFNRIPARLIEPKEEKTFVLIKPDTVDQNEWDDWKEKLDSTDPLTRADMLAEYEQTTVRQIPVESEA